MKNLSKVSLVLFLIFATGTTIIVAAEKSDSASFSEHRDLGASIYQSLDSRNLSQAAFLHAYRGYWQLLSKNALHKKHLLTIIDFDRSSAQERFFVIDLNKRSVIYRSLVAHGKNSGWDIPTSFSNEANSYKSSLGFYLTGEIYIGKHGLSLRLDGLEKGINDNARRRRIVIHSAEYVSYDIIKKIGRLGRSFGCPSLPSKNYTQIIDLIKDKSLVFIYSNQKCYFDQSDYL